MNSNKMTNYTHKKATSYRVLRIGFLIFTVLSIQACVSFKTWYYWADTYISWEVDRFFNLSSEQEEFVDKQLDIILTKHRQQEIPKYIAFLKEIKNRLNRQVVEEDVIWFRQSLKEFYANIAHLLADDAAELLSNISLKQINHLEGELAEENEEWLAEHGEDNEDEGRQEKRLERVYDRVEDWLGEITIEQEQKIKDLYSSSPGRNQVWFERRVASQKRFVAFLHQAKQKKELKEQLFDWYIHPEKHYEEDYKQLNKRWETRTIKVALILEETDTPDQRKYLKAKLDETIAQLNDLADQ